MIRTVARNTSDECPAPSGCNIEEKVVGVEREKMSSRAVQGPAETLHGAGGFYRRTRDGISTSFTPTASHPYRAHLVRS